jgi:hypothetical protein
VSGSRRLSNGFAFTVAYTGAWRKQLTNFDPFISADANYDRSYTYNASRPHNLVISYNYEIPPASKLWDNAVVKGVLDGWQISGISTFQSGQHAGFSYAFTGAPFNDMTGGPGGARVNVVCDPNLPKSERTQFRQFRTECIKPGGAAGDPFYMGTSTNDEWINLGYANHDITLFKNFAMPNRKTLQIRIELYNAFNTTQYSGVDTSAVFNFATGEQTDTGFGTVTGTRANSARVIQLGARFTF